MKDTLSLILSTSNDTLVFAIKNAANIDPYAQSNFLYSKEFWVAIFGLLGVLVGAIGSWYFKSKEINTKLSEVKILQENLLLQSKLFEETKTNNENQMKAELVRLNDLRNQYELSLKKFDFEHLKSVLEFAGDKDEKAKMMRDFANILEKIHLYIPDYVNDFDEAKEYTVNHIYLKLSLIESEIINLLNENPHVFTSIHGDFKSVSTEANYLKRQSIEFQSFNENITDEQIIDRFSDSLYNLYQDLIGLMDKMKEEFSDLDMIKKQFIKSQIAKSK
jgi:hypothetical protein